VQVRLGPMVDGSWPAAAGRIVPERIWSAIRVASVPQQDGADVDMQPTRDLWRGQAVSGLQDDAGTPDHPLRSRPGTGPRAEQMSMRLAETEFRCLLDCHGGRLQ
jgi:hypothetical protein